MSGITFEGRVAVVTGAGGGLGRSHALDLAARGAKVVVNDLGGDITGTGSGTSMADQVVKEIEEAGGTAVACYDSVATPEGGAAIVRTALDAFGTLDILVNNAGNIRNAPFTSLTPEAIDALLAVHVRGAFYVTQPAFAVMRDKRYGRIVFTSSGAGVFGNKEQANYAAAKTALLGLANVVALEGAPYGIKANTILPTAASRMAEGMSADSMADAPTTPAHHAPEVITAMVTYLASETNPYSQEAFSVARGRYARVFTGVVDGWYVPPTDPVPTADDVHAHIDRIRDRSVYHVPGSLWDELTLMP
ncbi:SDR family NAD(P)-dependent oxidoreductase [Streptomyces fuscichromogenes]|uniref:Short-chain dehydrogenase n=1 Tax=Streptomyces fuscichromogenes TaxID=1324013 RepID=A0A917XGI6_9ACTN|nr:SDR family NAD(P)-dependent oxidoreductase [Streptomyces fuscichromogenes]GGN23037.1 short-chain dehydrogenase [Streptomyces fuscichromogenes]